MNVLVIAEEERAQIKAALAEARKRPLSLEEGKRLAAQIPQGKTELTIEDRKNARWIGRRRFTSCCREITGWRSLSKNTRSAWCVICRYQYRDPATCRALKPVISFSRFSA
jgi:hypothetical protein